MGGRDEDWNNPDNWVDGIIPDQTLDAYIPDYSSNFPDLTEDSGECNAIVLFAESNGPASIMGNEYLIFTYAQVETYITTGQWHMISPPVYGETAGLFHFPSDAVTYLTSFDGQYDAYKKLTQREEILETVNIYSYNNQLNIKSPEGI